MKLLFLTPYFPPEIGAPQTRIYELATRLVRMGNEVSVLTTFPNYPTGVVPLRWRGRFYCEEVQEGIRVHRIWTYAVPNQGFLKRILSQLSFALFAALGGFLVPKCQAIIVESPPLFDGLAGLFLSWKMRAPYLFTVADLWPESAVQMGVLKNPLLIWLSRKLEQFLYRRAGKVLAITAGIQKKIICNGIQPSKVVLFRNAVDPQFFCPNASGPETRQQIGIAMDDFMVLYAGTLGIAHDLGVILESALKFQTEGKMHVRFVLAGDGAEKKSLQKVANDLRLTNVTFLDSLPKSKMPSLLNAADCVVVSLRGLEIFRGAIPTKLLEAMSCAKPIILSAAGEAEDVVREAKAGFCVTPGDPLGLYGALLQIIQEPRSGVLMGLKGREYVMAHFSRDEQAQQLLHHLRAVAETPVRESVSSALAHSAPSASSVIEGPPIPCIASPNHRPFRSNNLE
jgi:colanic acid biosynthesis glycosyl transferase WcaI